MILNWLQYLKGPQEGWRQYLRNCCRQWTEETAFVLCLRKEKEKEKKHWVQNIFFFLNEKMFLSLKQSGQGLGNKLPLPFCNFTNLCPIKELWVSLVYYSSVEKQSCYVACFSLHLYVKDLLNMTFLGYIFTFLEFSL